MNGPEKDVMINAEQELLVYKKNSVEVKYRIFQIYGQKYIKRMEPFIAPDDWSEIYVTNIPRDMAIEDIFLFFTQCGEIYQLRLLMDFSGFNRGHCFIQYQDVTDSRAAICCLHDEEIAPGYKLTIKLSLNNNQLIIKSLPAFLSESYVKEKIQEIIGEGLVDVALKPSRISTRNYCFCTFQDHQFAVMAHKKVWPFINIAGHVADVHWAVPEILRYGINLYFTNCPDKLTKQEFFTVLKNKVDIKSVIQFRLSENFGYITFANRMYLTFAETILKDVIIRGRQLIISRTPFADQYDQAVGQCSNNENCAHLLSQNACNTHQCYYLDMPTILGNAQWVNRPSVYPQCSYYTARQVPYSYPIQQSARTLTQYGAFSTAHSNSQPVVPIPARIHHCGSRSCALTVTVSEVLYQNNYPTYSLFPREGERSCIFTTATTHSTATSTTSRPSNVTTSSIAQEVETLWNNAFYKNNKKDENEPFNYKTLDKKMDHNL